MNLKQLRKFVKIRNASQFQNNLQFQLDASEAGFDVRELGNAAGCFEPGSLIVKFWYWTTRFGILVEKDGKLRLFAKETK